MLPASRLAASRSVGYGSTSTTTTQPPAPAAPAAAAATPPPTHNNQDNWLPASGEGVLTLKPTYQVFSDRKRFATAFLLWLIGGIFGFHHFYLRGYRNRFTWIYFITSVLSFTTSSLLWNYLRTENKHDGSGTLAKWCMSHDEPTIMKEQTCINLATSLFVIIPIFTPLLRWLMDGARKKKYFFYKIFFVFVDDFLDSSIFIF